VSQIYNYFLLSIIVLLIEAENTPR